MKVTMILADSAQAIGNKLFILGGGWSITAPGVPHSVALYFQVPWDVTNQRHEFVLELLTSDGDPFVNEEGQALNATGSFETGRPVDLLPGTPMDVAMVINVPPQRYQENARYEWRLSVDGEAKDEWRLPFSTRSPQQAPPGPPPDQAPQA